MAKPQATFFRKVWADGTRDWYLKIKGDRQRYGPFPNKLQAIRWLRFPIALGWGDPQMPSTKHSHFSLVSGDSMINFGLSGGDIIRIEDDWSVRGGHFVGAEKKLSNKQYQRTLKQYWRKANGDVELRPGNPKYKPIIIPKQELSKCRFYRVVGRVPMPFGVLRDSKIIKGYA